jgi:hypothetical protein
LRCSGNAKAGFGDAVLKVIPLMVVPLGRSPPALEHLGTRRPRRDVRPTVSRKEDQSKADDKTQKGNTENEQQSHNLTLIAAE